MKLVVYRSGGKEHLGLADVEQQAVFEIDTSGDDPPERLRQLIERGDAAAAVETTRDGVALPAVELLAPLPRPARNIFCVGKNYRDHSAEFAASGFDASADTAQEPSADTERSGEYPSRPIFFTKPPSSVIGPDSLIDPHSSLTAALDYEAELAVIIGPGGRSISRQRAWDHVWGYTIVNDATARDLQRRHTQWFLGKSLDTFCPMGPWAVTADEVDPTDLTLECWVNGELRQHANTRDLIFDIPALISTLSAGISLQPGDVIATGTPAGVGIGFDPPRFLQPGDVVSIRITTLGTLTNRVGQEGD